MEDTLIISNTTPIINFAEIGRIDLLESLFGTVVIPPAVEKEVRVKASPFPHASKIVEQGNYPIVAPADELLVRALCATVHPGEAECIALAMERQGSLLLLDDLGARDMAKANGCLFIGTVGILIEANRSGLIGDLEPFFSDLRTKARFWLADNLVDQVLRELR